MKTELDLIAEDFRKAAEHHARAGRFAPAQGYLELWAAASGASQEESEGE